MIEVAGIQYPQVAPIKIYTIKVQVIRIFVGLPSIGSEIQYSSFFINANNILAVKRTRSNLIFQVTVSIVQVKMGPTIPFAPFNNFISVIYNSRSPGFNIRVQSFRNQCFYISRININKTQINS